MSRKHLHLLETVFQDTHNANIHWREIESLLNHLGAEVEPAHGARFKVTLNGITDFLHHPHHSSVCSRDLVKRLRELLGRAGVTLTTYDQERKA